MFPSFEYIFTIWAQIIINGTELANKLSSIIIIKQIRYV